MMAVASRQRAPPTMGARISMVFCDPSPNLADLSGFVDIPNRGSSEHRSCASRNLRFRFDGALALICAIRSAALGVESAAAAALARTAGARSRRRLDVRRLQCRAWPQGANLACGWGLEWERSHALGLSRLIAAAIALPLLSGCAGLHLDQEPDQVIQRTEGEDNYAERQKAGPVAARVLPYALLAEQSYDPRVYATHRMAPRATACAADDPKDCDARADDERAARWLDEWRYVWSCDGPDECGVRTAGQSEPVGGLGGPNLGAQGREMSGSCHRLSRNRRRRQG